MICSKGSQLKRNRKRWPHTVESITVFGAFRALLGQRLWPRVQSFSQKFVHAFECQCSIHTRKAFWMHRFRTALEVFCTGNSQGSRHARKGRPSRPATLSPPKSTERALFWNQKHLLALFMIPFYSLSLRIRFWWPSRFEWLRFTAFVPYLLFTMLFNFWNSFEQFESLSCGKGEPYDS